MLHSDKIIHPYMEIEQSVIISRTKLKCDTSDIILFLHFCMHVMCHNSSETLAFIVAQ